MLHSIKTIMSTLFICASLQTVSAANTTVDVRVRNLGDAKLSYMRSYGGMMPGLHISPELDADSCATIDLGDEGTVEHVFFLLRGKGRTEGYDIYLPAGETCTVTVDPLADEVFTSDMSAEVKAAIAVATSTYDAYFDFLSGKSDRFGLRRDSVAWSVVKKLTAFADSAGTVIAKAPSALGEPLRQQMRLPLGMIMSECAARWRNRGASAENMAQWNNATDSVIKWIGHDAAGNCLSTAYRLALGEGINRDMMQKLNRDERPSAEWFNSHAFGFYRDNLSGKNAEAMMAAVVIHDSRDNRFSDGIPALAEAFRSAYPSSPLLPLVEAAAAENMKRNAPHSSEGINFVDASKISTVSELIGLYKGRPVLVDIWATTCGPCRNSFMKLDPVRKVAAEKGVVLLYVAIDEGDDADKKVRRLVERLDVKGDHVVAGPELHKDVFATFANRVIMIPHTALYGPDGSLVVKKFTSSEEPDQLAKDLVRALEK